MAVTIGWRENGIVVQDPISFGTLEALDTSSSKIINISHDSRLAIIDCGLFISSALKDYNGSRYPVFDYDQVIRYGIEFPNFGLAIRQTYTATGTIDEYSGTRLRDLERFEEIDIFNQSSLSTLVSPPVIEILDGGAVGETSEIVSYDPRTKLFELVTSFSENVAGAQYQIELETLDYIKNQRGTSRDYPIPLLNKAGVINRNETIDIELFLKVPKTILAASNLLIDFNLIFFSTDID